MQDNGSRQVIKMKEIKPLNFHNVHYTPFLIAMFVKISGQINVFCMFIFGLIKNILNFAFCNKSIIYLFN